MKRFLFTFIFALILSLVSSLCHAELSLDCSDPVSLSSFVQAVRSRNITGETLIIADQELCAKEMIAVKMDEEGNVLRPAILGCFQFAGDNVSIFIGQRVINGKALMQGQRLTITNITDTGVVE